MALPRLFEFSYGCRMKSRGEERLCDCPPKSGVRSRRTVIGSWAKLLSKAAIAAGLVYWTSSEGVWGDNNDTEDLYYRIVETVAPVLPELPDLNEMKLPHVDSMKHKFYEAYNHFVCSAIGGLAEIPLAVKQKITDAILPCEKAIDGKSNEDGTAESRRSEENED